MELSLSLVTIKPFLINFFSISELFGTPDLLNSIIRSFYGMVMLLSRKKILVAWLPLRLKDFPARRDYQEYISRRSPMHNSGIEIAAVSQR